MSPIEQFIDLLVRLEIERIEQLNIYKECRESAFLLGVAIGLHRPLMEREEKAYRRTFLSVIALLTLDRAEYLPSKKWFLAKCDLLEDWLGREPSFKEEFEKIIGRKMDAPYKPHQTSLETRELLRSNVRQLSRAFGENLNDVQIESLIQRLENPLDK